MSKRRPQKGSTRSSTGKQSTINYINENNLYKHSRYYFCYKNDVRVGKWVKGAIANDEEERVRVKQRGTDYTSKNLAKKGSHAS